MFIYFFSNNRAIKEGVSFLRLQIWNLNTNHWKCFRDQRTVLNVTIWFIEAGNNLLLNSPFSWYVSGWRPCSRTCGKGVQKRQVECRQEETRGKYKTVSDSKCSGAKPTDPTSQDCNKIDCPAENVPGDWSKVTTSYKTNSSWIRSLELKRGWGEGNKTNRKGIKRGWLIDWEGEGKKSIIFNPSCRLAWSPAYLPSYLLVLRDTNFINQYPIYIFSFQCSTSCEEGIRTRTTSCQHLKATGVFQAVPEVMCATAIVPPQKEACNQDVPCPGSTIKKANKISDVIDLSFKF